MHFSHRATNHTCSEWFAWDEPSWQLQSFQWPTKIIICSSDEIFIKSDLNYILKDFVWAYAFGCNGTSWTVHVLLTQYIQNKVSKSLAQNWYWKHNLLSWKAATILSGILVHLFCCMCSVHCPKQRKPPYPYHNEDVTEDRKREY